MIRSLGDISFRRMDRKVTIPGNVEFAQELIMSVYNDAEGKTRKFIHEWHKDYYQDIGTGVMSNDLHGYVQGNVIVYQLDQKHDRAQKFIFRNAYPKLFGGMDLSHENEDQLLIFTLGFAFSFYQYSNDSQSGFSDIDKAV